MLTEKQKAFAINVASGMNITESAIDAGYSERSASSMGSQTMKIPKVKEAIEQYQEDERSAMQRRLAGKVGKMFNELIRVYYDEGTPPQVKANIFKDVMDRAGYKPKDEIDLQGGMDIEVGWVDDE